jgi:hypothetical protein
VEYIVARTVRDQNLETRSARGRLKPSPKPYYRTIDTGLHLGYRKGKNGGRWVVRWYVGEQDYKTETIANADDIADADGVAILSFAQAQAVAREMRARAARLAAGLSVETGPYTVKQCMAEYLTWMSRTGRALEMPVTAQKLSSSPNSGQLNVRSLGRVSFGDGCRKSRKRQHVFGGRRAAVRGSARSTRMMRILHDDGELQRTAR